MSGRGYAKGTLGAYNNNTGRPSHIESADLGCYRYGFLQQFSFMSTILDWKQEKQ